MSSFRRGLGNSSTLSVVKKENYHPGLNVKSAAKAEKYIVLSLIRSKISTAVVKAEEQRRKKEIIMGERPL